MIKGYSHLSDNISKTLNLIKDVEGSSKEQLLGIEQINSAVTQLDQQTQKNANVASQTKEIAQNTQFIANTIVKNANDKNFNGKDTVKAKDLNMKGLDQVIDVKKEQIKKTETKPKVESKESSNHNVKIVSSSAKDNDEWESF
jgi:methyl-accepting chemotaxis protein